MAHKGPGSDDVVVLLRGTPGVGKSTVARRLVERLGEGAVVEVDRFRAMLAIPDWHSRAQHAAGLVAACRAAAGFVEAGVAPVVVVDTFGRDGVARARALFGSAVARGRCVTLWAAPEVIEERLARRAAGYADVAQCHLINAEVLRRRLDDDLLIDTSRLDVESVVDRIHAALGLVRGGQRHGDARGRTDDGRTGVIR